MRSVVADTLGEPSEVLHLQIRPIPELGPDQVRIRVAAVPVHASDLHTIRGRYGFTPEFPTVPGIESVGVIDELGSGTDGLTVGQRVVTIGVTGTWQEYVIADAERVLPVPAGMSDSTAAQILSNPLTAVILTSDELDVRPGEWLLQTAAGSTVGQLVIQLGAHVGFKTLNVVRRRSAVEDILALGGTAVICTEDEDLRERVAEIAGTTACPRRSTVSAVRWVRTCRVRWRRTVSWSSTVRCPRTAKPIPTNSPSPYSRAH
jgi:NADPH:quinone reductase-like Zn-dependent oxidoreductase